MSQYQVLDLFSGIGGFSLGLERAGMKTVAFCEIEEYPRKVLNKHWPDVPIYEDVRNVTAERLRSDGIGRIDVVTGGFPCQDISVAGNQKGIIEGDRSSLWGELCRIIGDIRPSYAIVENVTALISGDNGRWFGKVLGDLAEIGYDCEWHCIPASELGAHHHRDRVWIICYPQHVGQFATEIRESNQAGNGSNQKRAGPTSEFTRSSDSKTLGDPQIIVSHECNPESEPCGSGSQIWESGRASIENNLSNTKGEQGGRIFKSQIQSYTPASCWWDVESRVGRVANGIPDRTHRLKGLGNAVVPQIPELIGRAIIENDSQIKADKS
jgi:DNA (cytosine-5)-methyltransferase 1